MEFFPYPFGVPLAMLATCLLFAGVGAVGGAGSANSRTVRSQAHLSAGASDAITVDEAATWLAEHRPHAIAADAALELGHARQAVDSRHRYPWAASVPRALFEESVLPFTHLDEAREAENWRPKFAEKLAPLLREDMTLKEAATAIQQGIWTSFGEPAIVFKGDQTPNVLSFSDVLEKRYGSCTGLAIFLADGLRSCGVPARIVGTTEWNRPEKGNHNWVEAWFDGRWNFIDPAPGPATWNEAWFVEVAQQAVPHGIHGIYTPVTWTPALADAEFALSWHTPPQVVPAVELTAQYKHAPWYKSTYWGRIILLAVALPLLVVVFGSCFYGFRGKLAASPRAEC